jgi:uncharacterized protein with NRDE domain
MLRAPLSPRVCTLAFAWQVFGGAPLVAAANRDEAYGRPASPPAVRGESPRVLCPLDERAGGTWIGVNEHGLFAAVTNRPADVGGDRSRGLLLRDVLAGRTATDGLETIERALEERPYAGFNLVVADAGGTAAADSTPPKCLLFAWDGRLRTRALDPGVHVVVNAGADEETPKASRIRAALRAADAETPDAWRDAARAVLRDHDLAACVHGDGGGTRSSSLVTVRADGGVDYAFADGPPCETAHAPVDAEGHF